MDAESARLRHRTCLNCLGELPAVSDIMVYPGRHCVAVASIEGLNRSLTLALNHNDGAFISSSQQSEH